MQTEQVAVRVQQMPTSRHHMFSPGNACEVHICAARLLHATESVGLGCIPSPPFPTLPAAAIRGGADGAAAAAAAATANAAVIDSAGAQHSAAESRRRKTHRSRDVRNALHPSAMPIPTALVEARMHSITCVLASCLCLL